MPESISKRSKGRVEKGKASSSSCRTIRTRPPALSMRPGSPTLVMSKAGINIDSVYVTTHGYIVLGVDDMAGAIQIAAGMAVMAFE